MAPYAICKMWAWTTQPTCNIPWPWLGRQEVQNPTSGSRPFWVRAAILASLQASPEAASPDCQRVTWEDLASIRHLQLSQPQTGTGQFEFLRRELAGLTGLEFLQLDLRTASTLSGNWLAHTRPAYKVRVGGTQTEEVAPRPVADRAALALSGTGGAGRHTAAGTCCPMYPI